MDIKFEDVLLVIFLLGAAQGLVLTFLLFSAKNNKLANRLLGLLTLTWAIILCFFVFSLKGLMATYPHFLRTVTNIEFAFFPLLYLNIKYLLKKNETFNRLDLLHFIPLVFNILLFSWFYFESAETKYYLVDNNTGYYYYINIISDEILGLQGIIYSILALILLRKYNTSVLNYNSYNDLSLLKYLKIGVYILLISWTIGTVAVNLDFLNIDINVDLFLFTYLLIVVVIYVISYSALRSREVFKLSEEQISESFITSRGVLKFDSNIKTQSQNEDIEIIELNKQLIKYIDENKPFLNPELSLQNLADGLGISRHQTSAIINQVHRVNFYEFVNTYRVNEVKNNLQDPSKRHFKIISLAYDAGFNSKASFNRIFKQYTNQTPSEFLVSLSDK